MNRIKQPELRIKHFTILVLLFLSLILNSNSLILNANAQSSPEPSASNSAQLLNKPIKVLGDQATDAGILSKPADTIDQKLEDLKKDIASKAAELKGEVNKKLENKAVLGKSTVITTDTITLETKNGNRTIKMNEYTLFADNSKQKSKKAFTGDLLKTDDTLVCLGDMDEKGIMVAKKIIRTDPPPTQQNKYLYGHIGTVSNLSFVLEMKQLPGSQNTLVNFNGATTVQNAKEDGSINDIKQGRTTIIVGSPKNEATEAKFIYLIPVTGMIKPVSVIKPINPITQ